MIEREEKLEKCKFLLERICYGIDHLCGYDGSYEGEREDCDIWQLRPEIKKLIEEEEYSALKTATDELKYWKESYFELREGVKEKLGLTNNPPKDIILSMVENAVKKADKLEDLMAGDTY